MSPQTVDGTFREPPDDRRRLFKGEHRSRHPAQKKSPAVAERGSPDEASFAFGTRLIRLPLVNQVFQLSRPCKMTPRPNVATGPAPAIALLIRQAPFVGTTVAISPAIVPQNLLGFPIRSTVSSYCRRWCG